MSSRALERVAQGTVFKRPSRCERSQRCHLQLGVGPSSHQREEGGGVTKKMSRSLLVDADGVVLLVPSIGTPPRSREKRMLRDNFLIARPPLLAVMRGGDYA